MDIASLVGLILGIGSMLIAFVLDGGHITTLFAPTALLIVVGGTFGAIILSFSMDDMKSVGTLLKIAFTEKKQDIATVIASLVSFAEKARREGLLSLEADINAIDDDFLKQGMQLVVDGTDPTLVRNILETQITFIEQRHKIGSQIFEAAGGYAPTMGIIGTVMGLVHVLGNLSEPSKLGQAIAVAFIATLYGVATANLFWLPVGTKLKLKSKNEMLSREVMLEGILSIQAGDNPRIVEEKLKAFLSPKLRESNFNQGGA
jgi:chemotaxis protein MotA